MGSAFIVTAFAQPDHVAAKAQWCLVADRMRGKLATLMDRADEDVPGYMKLHSTDPIKRLNREIKRGRDVVGIFSDEASIRRLVGALLIEQAEKWTVQRARQITLETLAPRAELHHLAGHHLDAGAASPAGQRQGQRHVRVEPDRQRAALLQRFVAGRPVPGHACAAKLWDGHFEWHTDTTLSAS